jgi:hypothetical protein
MLDAVSPGRGPKYCDGLTRRDFLRVGALGAGGLALADLLRLKAQGNPQPVRRCRSVIMVYLSGGPSHIDTYDLKPNAPLEFRGEFSPIATKLPGLQLCELMPLQAKIADRLALVRSLQMGFNDHQNQCEMICGFPAQVVGGKPAAPQRPAFGSVVSRFGAPPATKLPRYVSLTEDDSNHRGQEDPAYVGPAHRPFIPSGPGLENLRLARGIPADRLQERKQLLRTFDDLRRDLDAKRDMLGMDVYTAQALDMISSNGVRDAFDITREPDRVVAKYGDPAVSRTAVKTSGGYRWGPTKFIQARRLVEAGVPVVTLFLNGWDHHGRIGGEKLGVFEKLRGILPALDAYLYGLVTDLHERGLDQEVAVVVWGEFGRAPRIDQKVVGRDHWPAANFVLFAGGGLRMGQVIGATDAKAATVKDRPFTPQNVMATLYHVLGIDLNQTVPDHQGRPMYLLEDREPIAELV